jgi:hypothetical protein
MGRIDWARAAQFNVAFDNMGGTPLQEAVAAAGRNFGAGRGRRPSPWPQPRWQVCFIRGIYTGTGVSGTASGPTMSGDLTNYYQGGSTATREATIITLGTPAAETRFSSITSIHRERAARYEPLNNYPCIRSHRSRDTMLRFRGSVAGPEASPLCRVSGEGSHPATVLWRPSLAEQSRTSHSYEIRLNAWDRGAPDVRGASPGVAL